MTADKKDVTFRFNTQESQALAISIMADSTNKSALLNIGHADETVRSVCAYKVKVKNESNFNQSDSQITERNNYFNITNQLLE
jgi:hypothetical protein